ncbi:MAG: ATP-binding protein, partial [Candidatus Paceibacteria bacterium]
DSISTILSEARKYRLNLTIAHQFIGQLEESIKSSVFGNVGTSIILRVGTDDAQYLENKVQPQFSAYDLSRLDNLNAVVALMIQGETSKPFNMEILFAKSGDRTLQEALVELSRLKYGTKKSLVARDIKRRAQIG